MQEKTRAYLAAGAVEVWLVAEAGNVRHCGAGGERSASRYAIAFSLPAPLKE